uniref:Uncharacterized protein n=1 Tax=Rhizophora mucronata TaxID=61149 RepID=A0A2P2QC70_RHIMU
MDYLIQAYDLTKKLLRITTWVQLSFDDPR